MLAEIVQHDIIGAKFRHPTLANFSLLGHERIQSLTCTINKLFIDLSCKNAATKMTITMVNKTKAKWSAAEFSGATAVM